MGSSNCQSNNNRTRKLLSPMSTGKNGYKVMKARILVLAFATMVALASCTATKTVSTARYLDPDTQEMIADLEVSNTKVVGEYKCNVKKNAYVNEQELKDNAVYNALQPVNADVLVAPQYRFVKEVHGKRCVYTVTVNGYSAFYRNFRPVEKERVTDVELKEVNGLIFMLTKNNFGETVGYQVVVPTDKKTAVIDADKKLLEDLNIDYVVLTPRDDRKPVKVEKSESSSQESKFVDKIEKKIKKGKK